MTAAAASMCDMDHESESSIDLSGLSLIAGLGATGRSVARYLRARGLPVRVIDSRANPPELDALVAEYPDIEIHTSTLSTEWLMDVQRLVLSPGLPIDLPIVATARERRIAVINDIEIFAQLAPAPIAAVTGSNGKSTVVSLVERFAAALGKRVPAGGNVGTPALDLLSTPTVDAYVLEISSFQMEACDSLRPVVGAVLNVTADHLDRHRDFSEYAALKAKVIAGAGCAIVNRDDAIVVDMARAHPRTIEYSLIEPLARGYCLREHAGGRAIVRDGEPLIGVDEVMMRGEHNLANAMAALAVGEVLGVDPSAAVDVLRSFPGLAHRCEYVTERQGVVYINDSKATNIGAAAAALKGLRGPIILIAGGDGKGADFATLREHVQGKVRGVFVIGRSAPEIQAALASECEVVACRTLEEAVDLAATLAEPGDTVLLAPACSSLDMFADYRARGAAFRAAVEDLGS